MTKRPARPRQTADTTTPAALAVGAPQLALDQPADDHQLPELMTTAEVAAALRVRVWAVRDYVARGVLPGYRVGRELRIPRSAVARHLHSLRVNP